MRFRAEKADEADMSEKVAEDVAVLLDLRRK